jgi:hypothetical protein
MKIVGESKRQRKANREKVEEEEKQQEIDDKLEAQKKVEDRKAELTAELKAINKTQEQSKGDIPLTVNASCKVPPKMEPSEIEELKQWKESKN